MSKTNAMSDVSWQSKSLFWWLVAIFEKMLATVSIVQKMMTTWQNRNSPHNKTGLRLIKDSLMAFVYGVLLCTTPYFILACLLFPYGYFIQKVTGKPFLWLDMFDVFLYTALWIGIVLMIDHIKTPKIERQGNLLFLKEIAIFANLWSCGKFCAKWIFNIKIRKFFVKK